MCISDGKEMCLLFARRHDLVSICSNEALDSQFVQPGVKYQNVGAWTIFAAQKLDHFRKEAIKRRRTVKHQMLSPHNFVAVKIVVPLILQWD